MNFPIKNFVYPPVFIRFQKDMVLCFRIHSVGKVFMRIDPKHGQYFMYSTEYKSYNRFHYFLTLFSYVFFLYFFIFFTVLVNIAVHSLVFLNNTFSSFFFLLMRFFFLFVLNICFQFFYFFLDVFRVYLV